VLQKIGADLRADRRRLVDLVDRHNDRHARRLGVIDRFNRLRHDGVIGRHHQNGDIGRLGATGTHRGKGGVARRIDEGDQLTVLLDLIGTDVLGDATGFARTTLALRIASSSEVLPWSTWPMMVTTGGRGLQFHLVALVVPKILQLDVGFRHALDRVAEFTGDEFSKIGVDDVARLHHLAFLHQILDHIDRAFGHALRKFLNGDGFRQCNFAGNLLARSPASSSGASFPGGGASRTASGHGNCRHR
jgi:hypothetical protein